MFPRVEMALNVFFAVKTPGGGSLGLVHSASREKAATFMAYSAASFPSAPFHRVVLRRQQWRTSNRKYSSPGSNNGLRHTRSRNVRAFRFCYSSPPFSTPLFFPFFSPRPVLPGFALCPRRVPGDSLKTLFSRGPTMLEERRGGIISSAWKIRVFHWQATFYRGRYRNDLERAIPRRVSAFRVHRRRGEALDVDGLIRSEHRNAGIPGDFLFMLISIAM